MDLVSKTLFLCLAFALTRAGPLQDSAAGDGKPPKCSDVKLGAITTDDAGTTYIFADITERHCEHLKKRVEARGGLMGAYLPQCDDNGQYLPDQRHGSTGYHWCADSKGQKIPGTDTPPGVPNVNCSKPDEPQRLCQRHKDELKGIDTSVGVFVPECDENGDYQPKQCHASTGECRCVDKRGIQISGTETRAGSPPPDCSKADKPKGSTTKCQKHRDSKKTTTTGGQPIAGVFVPQCGENGEYLQKQCHGSTGHCWCVDSAGLEIPGTKTPPGTPSVDCSKAAERHCEHHKTRVEATGTLIGGFLPKCDENGKYQPQQCHASTGHCWCVNKKGTEKPGTRTAPGTPPVDCSTTDGPQRHCERHRNSIQAKGVLIGAFLPQCDENGHYQPQQCHGSTGHCWCVDKMGQERPGTRTPPGTQSVDCVKASRVYMRLDTIPDGLHSLPITRAWQEVGDRVEAVFSYSDKMYLIEGGRIYTYLVGSNITRIGDFPKYLHEMGIEGPVDAAFVCPDEHIVHIIQGNRMKDVDLSATEWAVIREFPLPLSDIDAGLCGPDGIKLFKGSEYYHYESPMILAMGRIVPEPKKITSALLGCED
ncbi:thyroglobulin-like isoform X1 [Melanotaenia boesemani]|uniref:thyroglobulin-like isoform X1 n=1 Tax=Melanotaenia boesemani TaxID=1250792 RepID=UPI001C045E68|nr:thyroglobulin-like isoform X1 [Melanotaenia boesemani]